MKSLIVYAALFIVGVGFGLGAPYLASRYAQPYLPQFLQETVHPLTGTVTHKEREQDRLLMTVTTQDGTILATFQKQVPEIDLLVEEQDSVTLDVKQYEPFVTDPPILKVHKHARQDQEPAPPPPSSMEPEPLSDSQLNSSPTTGEISDHTEPSHLPLN
ncbi:MAG: hypothetical protein KC592_13550 [Nitrospira sp.]|nr:hypothetical protein [Nitrospira sp.]HBP89434.1 hypothetical protein [Nitrospiraceae bacterium]HNP29268.1 hypothetical protein [Nitrospirales bacterium]